MTTRKILFSNNYLSNFYPSPFVDNDGLQWPTGEHYFQAHKFFGISQKQFDAVRNASNPGKAKQLGRLYRLRNDWEQVKEDIMLQALRYKFLQNSMLLELLLKTGNSELIEHRPDPYWGDNIDGTGKNRLGALLMVVRDEFQKA